jgi:hypothetical protein
VHLFVNAQTDTSILSHYQISFRRAVSQPIGCSSQPLFAVPIHSLSAVHHGLRPMGIYLSMHKRIQASFVHWQTDARTAHGYREYHITKYFFQHHFFHKLLPKSPIFHKKTTLFSKNGF